MTEPTSDRRMAENEAYFKRVNKNVVKGLNDLKEMAKTDKYQHPIPEIDTPINFYCECSDENCRFRIKIPPKLYEQLHKNSSQFILYPGHRVPKIERVIKAEKDYIVVEKYMTPPGNVDKLQKTDVDNT